MAVRHLLRGHPLTLFDSPRWRTLDSGALEGVENMALDAGLMERARVTGEGVLRVYEWVRPTLSFGRHETVRAHFDAALLAREGVAVIRRPTGGRVLLHDHEVTYSISAPSFEGATRGDTAPDGTPSAAGYRAINAFLVSAMARLGIVVTAAQVGGGLRPGGAACFAEPSTGELLVGGRKLVGSAQVCERGALLQHGSILVADDQARIHTLAITPMTPALPAATLTAALGRTPSYGEVRDALFGALRALVAVVEPLDAGSVDAARFRAHYADPEWTWRR